MSCWAAEDIFRPNCQLKLQMGMVVNFLGTVWVRRRKDDVKQPAGSTEVGSCAK